MALSEEQKRKLAEKLKSDAVAEPAVSDKKKKRINTMPFLILGFIVFFGVYMYPFVADRWNAYRNSLLIGEYQQNEEYHADTNALEKMCLAAEAYNKKLDVGVPVVKQVGEQPDPEYESLLSNNEEGMMGYLDIPKIQIVVPIYHYSSDAVLDKGIGHIKGSSLPVGGKSTRSLLTGHRGLPESKLFTDLDKVEKGDRFYLHVDGRDLAYEVYDIQVVLPDEVGQIMIHDGEDEVTLITCTPYGANTHRLLVTGKRCEYDLELKKEEDSAGKVLQVKSAVTPQNAMVAGLVVFVSIILLYSLFSRKKKGAVRDD